MTGEVRGFPASDLEERFARGLEEVNAKFTFQFPIQTRYSIPGEEKNVDFVVFSGQRAYPIEINGPYFHETQAARFKDMNRERELNDVFRILGFEDLRTVWYYDLQTQFAATETAREILL